MPETILNKLRSKITKQKFVPLKPFIPNQFERTIWLLSKRFVYWANGYRREKPFINFQPLKMYTQRFGWKVGGVLLFYFYCCSGRNKWMSMATIYNIGLYFVKWLSNSLIETSDLILSEYSHMFFVAFVWCLQRTLRCITCAKWVRFVFGKFHISSLSAQLEF